MAYKQPSSGSFKMMGSSPAKRADVELVDPTTGEIKNLGKGVGAVKEGIEIEKANDRIMEDNMMNIGEEEGFNMTDEEYDTAIRKGTTKVNYSKDEVDTRKTHQTGIVETGGNPRVIAKTIGGEIDTKDLHKADDDPEQQGTVTYSDKPLGPSSNVTKGQPAYKMLRD